MIKKSLKPIPRFNSEAEEQKFWNSVDSTEYVDYSSLENWQFPNLKLTQKPVTIRLPETLITKLKIRANRQHIPYQTLIKNYLLQAV